MVVAAAALAVVGAANAARPALLTVGQQDRHATATFSAPGADLATIYVASNPDLASGGGFLEENIKRVDFLTADEIQRAAWVDGEQLEPGLYYVMLRAGDFECPRNPNCHSGVLEHGAAPDSEATRDVSRQGRGGLRPLRCDLSAAHGGAARRALAVPRLLAIEEQAADVPVANAERVLLE
jgi:hypothetical protein